MIEFTDAVPAEAAVAASGEDGASRGRSVAIVRGGWHKEDAIGQFGAVLGFPGVFGRSLDSLAGLLHDDPDQRAAGRWLVWVPSRHLADTHRADYAGIVDVLARAAEASGARITVVGPRPGE